MLFEGRVFVFKLMAEENFNIIIIGVGGQGLITLTKILAEAALSEGLDVKTSELHGLSQRGGSVETMIRFGPRVYSPLVKQGGADLVIALEMHEALRACYYASPDSKTIFLANDSIKPIPSEKPLTKNSIIKDLGRFSLKTILVPATEICQKEMNKEVLAGIYLIGFAAFKNLIPLKSSSVLRAIKKTIPEKHLELNVKAFNLAQN